MAYVLGPAIDFYARQHLCYSVYVPRQFRLSVTRVYCIKAAERISDFRPMCGYIS